MNKVIVGGTFDATGGSPSWLIEQLAKSLGGDWLCINGGYIDFIREFNPSTIDVLVWMPNVSNDEVKVIDRLISDNPNLILIQSKRVIEKSYDKDAVVGRVNKSRSVLGIMITKPEGKYHFDLLDSRGFIWASTTDIASVGSSIKMYLKYVQSEGNVV